MKDYELALACAVGSTVLLVIFILVIRRLRVRFTAEASPRLFRLLVSVSIDSNFRWICREHCDLSSDQSGTYYGTLADLRIGTDYLIRCGWIGAVEPAGQYGIALPGRWPTFLLWTVAIHEMFHLVRHVQGHAPFDVEAGLPWYSWGRFRKAVHEEFLVWRKTFRVDQIGAAVIVTVYLTAFFCPPVMTYLAYRNAI